LKLKRIGMAVAAATLAFTAGCGGSGGSDGGEASGSAEQAAAGSGLTKANFASKVSQAQAEAETAHLEAQVNAQGQQMSMSGDMDMSQKEPAFDLTMQGAAIGGNARFILLDRVIYLKMPGMGQGNKYLKIDASKRNDPMAQMFDQMMGQFDPSQAFEAFDAVTKVEERGTQEVDGTQTTQYAVTVDTRKALKAQGVGGEQAAQMPKTVTYDVWVDDDDLVRKLRMDVPDPSGSAASVGAVDMTMSQWGEPVDISAPPAGQTTDMSEMMGQMPSGPPSASQG
jgi:lipoprotein LprG